MVSRAYPSLFNEENDIVAACATANESGCYSNGCLAFAMHYLSAISSSSAGRRSRYGASASNDAAYPIGRGAFPERIRAAIVGAQARAVVLRL